MGGTPLKGVKLYLEGPGRECRPVSFVSTEEVRAATLSRISGRSSEESVEITLLADADGHLARQIDREGFRYKFDGSDISWSLIVA
jgi:hypothetical protein